MMSENKVEKLKHELNVIFNLLVHHPDYVLRAMYTKMKIKIQKEALVKTNIEGVLFNFDLTNLLHRHWYVGTSPVEILFYKRILKPGDVVIDVGANVGYMTAIFASIVGKNGQVHSFEPVPKLHSKLEMLAKENKNYNIITNPCAVGDTNGTITINVLKEGADYGTSSVVPGLRKEENIKEKIEVPVVKLDDYAKEQKLTKVSFVKIDVEGFEFPVLRGMELILKQFKPIILCEIMPAAYSLLDSNVNNLLEHMGWFNYKC